MSSPDENTKLLEQNGRNLHSSLSDTSLFSESESEYKSRWRSIRIMYLTMFLMSISFSICMSSIWPYLSQLDPGASESFLGWVVAAYSIGQLIASPLFGFWSNWRHSSKEPLCVALVINIIFNILYAYAGNFPAQRGFVLLVARAFLGVSAGCAAVIRSFIAGATSLKERTSALANIGAFQSSGFIIGPAIQATFVPMGYPGLVHNVAIRLDMYTAPTLLSAVVAIVNFLLIIVIFKEHRVADEESTPTNDKSSIQGGDGNEKKMTIDMKAAVSCIIIFFVVLFAFAVFETIGTPLTMDMYAWNKSKATLYNGIILAVASVVAILVYIVIKPLSKRVSERTILLGALVFLAAGFIVFLPWGNKFPVRPISNLTPAATNASNSTMNSNISTTESIVHKKSPAGLGCPLSYDWCSYTPQVQLPQYLAGVFFVSIGFPACSVMTFTIFSKILGSNPQGTMMGWLTAAGSLSRALGPIFISKMYSLYGPRVAFSCIIGAVTLTVFFLVVVYRRLVPASLRVPRQSPLNSPT